MAAIWGIIRNNLNPHNSHPCHHNVTSNDNVTSDPPPSTSSLDLMQDPALRPGASTLLQHQWIHENRRTLKKSWNGGGFMSKGRGSGGGPASEAHESVYR